MIDPSDVTNYYRTYKQLEEFALFCLVVFNKNADTTAVKLEKFLNFCHGFGKTNSHFEAIRNAEERYSMIDLVKKFGFGNNKVKSSGITALVRSGYDLRECSVDDLEKLPGFGMKTSRYFILHTRPKARVACLDTHMLKHLRRYAGIEIPKSLSKKKYLEIQKIFLDIADDLGETPAELDLRIWNNSRKNMVVWLP